MSAALTVHQVAGLLGVSPRTVRRHCAAGQLETRLTHGCRGGRGGVVYTIPLAVLRTPEPREARQVEQSAAPDPIDLNPFLQAGGRLAFKTAQARSLIVKRALALTAPGLTAKRQTLADEVGISLVTLYRWMREYQEGGTVSLIGKHAGAPEDPWPEQCAGTRSMDPAAINYVKHLYAGVGNGILQPKVAHVYRQLKEEARAQGWRIGSRATVYRIIGEMTPSELVMGRRGEAAWKREIMAKATRDDSVLLANEIWVGDHHQLDCFINYNGKPVRPWLTAWFDMATRSVTGWCLSVQPNSQTIALALRHGILTRGLPARAYIDNGKDYKSRLLNAGLQVRNRDYGQYERELAGAFFNLGIQPTFAIPYQPWAKTIERWFGTLTDQFTRYLLGWCGNKPENRPPGFDAHQLLAGGKLIGLEDLADRLVAWIDQYHNTEHSTLGATPNSVWEAKPKARQEQVEERALDFLLMKAEKVKVQADGIHRFNELYWHASLMPLVGMWAAIRYDPNRIGQLHVFYKDRYVCTATNKELLTMRATESELEAHRRQQARQRKAVMERLQGLRPASPAAVQGPATKRPSRKVVALTGMEQAAREAPPAEEDAPALRQGRRSMADRLLREQGLSVLQSS